MHNECDDCYVVALEYSYFRFFQNIHVTVKCYATYSGAGII